MDISRLILIQEAAYSVGLENGWTKEQIFEHILATITAMAEVEE